jgi:hypothetical protein
MKAFNFLIVFTLASMVGHSQKMKDISWYFSHYDTANSMNCFQIGSHSLSFDDKAVFINQKAVIEKDTASFFFLEVYSKRILVVSYYPNAQAPLSTGPQFRPKQKVEFIMLNNPSQRWLFDLRGAFNSECIVNFNELTGELELKRKIKGRKL